MTAEEARRRAIAAAHLNAFIVLTAEEGNGPALGVKDVIDVAGLPTTGGGRMLSATPAAEDAPAVACLRRAGAVVMGKTNLHEWAAGVTSANPHYGRVENPAAFGRMPGGSSGGSAAAMAAGLCDWALGTDTGGSIRIPAALCGVLGMKPTTGSIPMSGVIPLSRTLDTVGLFARSLSELQRAMGALTGNAEQAEQEARLPTLAIPETWIDGLDQSVTLLWSEVSRGIESVAMPNRDGLCRAHQTIVLYEAARFHKEWLEHRSERYGHDVLQYLKSGLDISAGAYADALEHRYRMAGVLDGILESLDALVLPTCPCVAPRWEDEDPSLRQRLTAFTRPFSLTGHPAISVPFTGASLPAGIQLVGRRGRDAALLRTAAWFSAKILKAEYGSGDGERSVSRAV